MVRNRLTTVGAIDPEVLAYTAGDDIALDLALAEADALGTAAHVTMLSRMPVDPPVITAAECRKVVRALIGIVGKARAGGLRIGLADQDIHLAVERMLTEKLGEAGRKVHTGRSRNDQVALDLRLHAKVRLIEVIESAGGLARVLVEFARRHAAVPMVGRTHMQPAMPSSVGLWADAHAEGLLDDAALLLAVYSLNDQCPLGSAASYGVPLPIDRQLVADLLGFSRPIHNVLYANNARGRNEQAILSALAGIMGTLSRLAQDLILWSMPEFGYFTLPSGFCTGSSIMPQKRNPDVLELVRARAAAVASSAALVGELVRAAPSGYNRDIQEAKGPFLKGLSVTRDTLRILGRLVGGIEVHPEALRAAFTPDVFATDRALELVAGGMPFREAYHHVKAHLDELGRMDPDAAIARKTHLGAPAGLDFQADLARCRDLARFAQDERRKLEKAFSRLMGVAWRL
ncbi:MAG TPA: argininosuccinate lyase [Kiritimatiellia bacterium]|nr:argininosuccinate lyase [Kiritimatiellia bacterium]HRZ11236.1 argininosuccinate lyase [Kiritimatiellia bacterium]HSA19087.1 argininosuccinate lyase [Kiritimatiellia bacterium]